MNNSEYFPSLFFDSRINFPFIIHSYNNIKMINNFLKQLEKYTIKKRKNEINTFIYNQNTHATFIICDYIQKVRKWIFFRRRIFSKTHCTYLNRYNSKFLRFIVTTYSPLQQNACHSQPTVYLRLYTSHETWRFRKYLIRSSTFLTSGVPAYFELLRCKNCVWLSDESFRFVPTWGGRGGGGGGNRMRDKSDRES